MSIRSKRAWLRRAVRAVNYLGVEECELFSGLSVHECRRRLEDDLRPPAVETRPLWARLTRVSHPLDGTVTDAGFDIHRMYRAHSNGSWARVRGVFEETPAGTRIHLRIGPSPNLRSTSLCVYALLSCIEALLTYAVFFRSVSSSGVRFGLAHPLLLLVLTPIPFLMVCAAVAAAASIREEGQFILERLGETCAARSEPVPRVWT